MIAVTVNALFTSWRKRGTTRQLATAIVCCVASALLLLPALLWYNTRFSALQASTSVLEIALMLIYVALWGCLVPCSVTTVYCLFTGLRDSNTSARIPRQRSKRTTQGNALAGGVSSLLGRQSSPGVAAVSYVPVNPGVPAPFVFGEGLPWGWLELRNGRLQGQKLALSRTVTTIGRDEDNDIWLDDETSSRHHAQLIWRDGQAYLADCDSLNGVLLNSRRMRGTMPVASGDFLEIGAQRFLIEMAQRPEPLNEEDDPLLAHLHRPMSSADQYDSTPSPAMRPERPGKPASAPAFPTRPLVDPVTPPVLPVPEPASAIPAMCLIRNGALAGASFAIDRPALSVGDLPGCDVRLEDAGALQAQFSHTTGGDYVAGSGILLNNRAVQAPCRLQEGDILTLGSIQLEYTFVSEIKTTPLPPPYLSPATLQARPADSLMRLRLPSKPR